MNKNSLKKLAALVRYYILTSTTRAGSGHPTSCLSAVDLLVGLFFAGHFRVDLDKPDLPNNDRLVFSKGHAAPLLYSLYAVAGKLTEQELLTLRKFRSPLEGHPTRNFPYVEAATGSLGQGLSIGVGLALNARYLDNLPYTTYVLLGDGEMAEGSVWEAMALADHYHLSNLVAIIDVNRLGQSGETMFGHDVDEYARKCSSFGWRTIVIDGHDLGEINRAYIEAHETVDQPIAIIAKTIKGKGIDFLEDKYDLHGKALRPEQLVEALNAGGKVEKNLSGRTVLPEDIAPSRLPIQLEKELELVSQEKMSTRQAGGQALVDLGSRYPQLVVLDADVANSTYTQYFQQAFPSRFFQMYIAEQNMIGAAVGLSVRGKLPLVATFAAFFTRAFDQLRMAQYSQVNLKLVGSHAGVSIGEDGPSQMGLEDIALFRTLLGSTIFYPADRVACQKLTQVMLETPGIVYLRTTRKATPVIYSPEEEFIAGGSKVLTQTANDQLTVVAAGITLFEALQAQAELERKNINIRVIDLYSIKPIDVETLRTAAYETKAILTVEDHFAAGGLGEAVRSALSGVRVLIHSLAVKKTPCSGRPSELINYEEISAQAIINKIKSII